MILSFGGFFSLVFLMFRFKPLFPFSSFTLKRLFSSSSLLSLQAATKEQPVPSNKDPAQLKVSIF